MFRRRAALLLGVVGFALLAAAAARVIYTSSSSGMVALVVIGAALLVSPFVISRVERFSASASGYELPLTREIAELGAPNAARILDRTELARYAEAYAVAGKELDDSRFDSAQAHLQDLLVQRAATLAHQEKFESAEVRTLFTNGSPSLRILAIGLMKGDPSLADGAAILAAIADPRSANEQYQGLELAKLCWPQLSRSYRSAIQSVIADSADIRTSSDRGDLAAELRSLPVS
jgi:hypothetical protein